MASYKLNIATIKGCPEPAAVAAALKEFGLPESEEFGVLNHSATSEAVFGTVIRKTQTAVQRLDRETGDILSEAVERVNVYPFGLKPSTQRLEIYAGTASGIEQLGAFFSSGLALPTLVEPIEIDVPDALDRLAGETKRFQLKAVRVNEYAHNSFMSGAYAPKFLDSEHGKEFIEQYLDFVVSASARFQGPTGRVNVALKPMACFTYSCSEEDQPWVQSLLRKLL